MSFIAKYIAYIRDIRRYSSRTVNIYTDALKNYLRLIHKSESVDDTVLTASLNRSEIRQYEVALMEEGLSARTVGLHLSALSSFCRYLMKEGVLKSNPVRLVTKPKVEKRLPVYFRKQAMEEYFNRISEQEDLQDLETFKTGWDTESGQELYEKRLSRLIISLLYNLGLRRAELISLTVGSIDFGRNIVKVTGKGDKMREIPLIASLCKEISLYLEAVETVCGGKRSLKEPLLITYKGKSLYPAYVDRVVKSELSDVKGITGRKSPHVLRHSLATELLNEDTNIHSIKEMLGHSSLAATQVYTHTDIARLKHIYKSAHPRAKNGGKNGD
ncbi:MAG: tyrosine-type recombinase/integrase [Bacteroidales bacterium]|nr:tyrosine-type recombinase/integrase [Bacteroidales bacterium]